MFSFLSFVHCMTWFLALTHNFGVLLWKYLFVNVSLKNAVPRSEHNPVGVVSAEKTTAGLFAPTVCIIGGPSLQSKAAVLFSVLIFKGTFIMCCLCRSFTYASLLSACYQFTFLLLVCKSFCFLVP